MLNKTKKVAFLTTGLAGALVVSSAVGVALSSCTTTDTSSSSKPNKYTYSIDWTDQNQIKQLTIDEQGIVYSSADKTEIITVAPNTATTSFVIPASVKYITGYNLITKNSSGVVTSSTPSGAFEGLTSLISVTFASDNTLISIGDSAFKGCTYLSTITLPSSTSVVYNNAFQNCVNLRNIGLTNVSYIGSSAFSGAMANGADVSINLSSASYIGDNAFENSTSLSSVDLSKNTTLTYIGKSAFKGSLVSGNATSTIDLSKATLLKTISDNAFQNCTNLGAVILPTTNIVSTIGQYAFNGATSLTQVGPTANTFTASSSLGNYATTAATSSTSYVSSGIGTHAFDGTKIAIIDLTAVTATTPFTNATFKNMASLATVNFGTNSKITTIPYSLFENATALTTLTFPASITTINDGANNPTSTSAADADNRSPFYNSGLATVDMTNITSYATSNITFANTVQVDGTSVVPAKLFQGLTSLKTVYLKTGTVGINIFAFDGTTALTTVKEGNSLTDATNGDGFLIPSTLGWVGYYVFQNSGIKSVAFANISTDTSNNLWFLGQSAFEGATSLKTVDLSKANITTNHQILESYVSAGGSTTNSLSGQGLFAIPSTLFKGATALTSVTLPSSITKIFSEAFSGNTELTAVNFDALTNLDTINTDNFNNTKLATIDLSKINSNNISALSNSFTNSTSTIFSNLPANAIVKLPAAMNFSSGLNTTAFTTTTSEGVTSRVAIEYPNGLNVVTGTNATSGSTTYVSIGSNGANDNPQSNSMLAYVSGDFNLAATTTGASIQEYYPRTFFGNTKLKSLTLSASGLSKTVSGSEKQLDALFIHHRGTNSFIGDTSYYTSQYLPFGNNSALTNLSFTGFDVSTTASRVDGDTTNNNPLFKMTNKTWAQVSTIINKFAANSTNTPTQWSNITNDNSPADQTSRIQYDSIFSGTASDASYSVSVTSSYDVEKGTSQTGSSETLTFTFAKNLGDADVKTWSFIHNGVTWTLNVTPNGAITLVGTNINVYRASRNNVTSPANYTQFNPYQICFNEGTEGTPSKITVTLNIYTPTTSTK